MAKAIVKSWDSLYDTPDIILGEIMHITLVYAVSDATSANVTSSASFNVNPLDTEAIVKANAAAAIVADASTLGYTLLPGDILFQDGTKV